ncbi:MAG: HAMP domain-containing protein [Ignavibacteria bacterium]|nr:HAMP domain-containing protein [Ignavibacteria bacterium]
MRSIQNKVTLTYILLSFAVITLLGLISSCEIERYYFNRVLLGLRSEAGVLSALVHEAVEVGEPRARTARYLNAIADAAQMRITLIDSAGWVIYDSAVPDSLLGTLENHRLRPEIVEANKRFEGSDVRISASVRGNLMYVARFVSPDDFRAPVFPHLQFIRVATDLTEVEAVINEIRFKIGIAGLVVLVLVLGVSRLVARKISNPLVEIGEMIKEIKAGNLDQKLPVRSDDEIGKLVELINALTDKLKADIEQLEKLGRVRSEFLANVSHELRTPIFSLKGFLETLLDGAVDDPKVNKMFVERAYHHANRLDVLLNDLIEISRIESGEMKMSFRYFELMSTLRQLVEDFADAATKKEQSITLKSDLQEISVLGDKERLRQALGNILDNAVKYSQERAAIVVRVQSLDGKIRILVSDSGPGIHEEHLPRIFERFYRVDKARSREVGGTGLGLAIAKHIIEAHNSKIHVTSELGKGTIFMFDLKS